MLFKSKPYVGLDIGSSAIKVLILKEAGKGNWTLQSLGIEPLPPEVIVDGAIMDANVVIETIKKLFSQLKIKSKKVVIGVSGHSIIVKKITLPQMSKEELEESIHWEAEQYIPFDIEDVNIDFHLLESEEERIGEEMDVILVAAKKDKINDYAGIVRQCGLEPVIVDVDGFAIYNQYELNYEWDPYAVALINIGASVMNINIVLEGKHMLYRDIHIGGNQYTDAIMKELNVAYDQAEGLKMGEEIKGISKEEVQSIMETINEDITLEIKRSFDYFSTTTSNIRVEKIVLTGGASKTMGLKEYLANKLGVEVVMGNPFNKISFNPKKYDPVYIQDIAPLFAVAVGLAIRRD